MNRVTFRILPALMLFLLAANLHAQHGCALSPEAPTDVLMLVGSAGMFYGSSVIMKLIRSRKQS